MLPYHNTKIEHWNPGATQPLILPVHLICNTDDEQLYSNVRVNSHSHSKNWVKVEEAHDGIAVLCGSGPSLADTLEEVREWAKKGAKIFAMNGAANFLAVNDIWPDYQCIIDARIETADLLGPAKEHLFASQVHPECFRRVPNARLWHLQIGGIEDHFPEYDDAYALIGGAASVGNTATCLAYTLGFREIHCYGYDSCHREGKGHAFRQKMNDGDPCAVIEFGGKTYVASLTMKLQAEKFQETALALKRAGCKLFVHGSGLLPDMYNTPLQISEAEKYERMWLYDDYRAVAPGEQCAAVFMACAKPSGRVIDFGCGTGRGALKLKEAGCDVLLVDFAGNSRDPEALRLPFRKHDLTQPLEETADYGFCTDVMEHIPPADVDKVLKTIFTSAPKVFFQISLVDDVCGELIGHPLHLSVYPYEWWLEKLGHYGRVVWSMRERQSAMFYVTEEK